MKNFLNCNHLCEALWLNQQDLLLFEGLSTRTLLILMRKVILGSLVAACLNQVLVILQWLVFQVESLVSF